MATEQNQKNWPRWRWILTGLNLLALVLSITLSWHYLSQGSLAGCGGGSPCDQVLGSRWSTIAGILPVSGVAVGAYLAMLIAGLFIGPSTESSMRRLAWTAMLVLAGAIAGSALWFIILQKWIIHQFCIYCMSTHLTGLFITMIVFVRAAKERFYPTNKIATNDQSNASDKPQPVLQPLQVLKFGLLGLFFAGIAATAQFNLSSSAAVQNDHLQSSLPKVDLHDAPIIGSPDAPYVVTLLFDYQCSHCQKLHFLLKQAIRNYNGKLAFVLCPAPLENSCNPYIPPGTTAFKNSCELAKIGLAVWHVKPEAFAEFDNWMFTFETGSYWLPRSLDAVKAKAAELLGQENLNEALADPWIDQYLKSSVSMFGQTIQNGKAGIPKMIYDSKWVIPEPYNAEDLVTILQKNLGLPKP